MGDAGEKAKLSTRLVFSALIVGFALGLTFRAIVDLTFRLIEWLLS